MSKQDLNSKLDTLNAIEEKDVKSPNSIPVDVYLQEAEALHYNASRDLDALISVGLDKDFVTDLPVRAGALRDAEAAWTTTRFTHEDAEKQWLEKSPAAYEFRNDLLKSFRYAFRKHSDLLGRVSAIAEGYGHADMIQDLYELSVLGQAHADLLTAIKFDLAVLDQAAQTSDELADLLGHATSDDDASDAIKLRNRAYTHLKECVDEVCDAGQYAFRNDSRKSPDYASAYLRRARQRTAKRKEEAAAASAE